MHENPMTIPASGLGSLRRSLAAFLVVPIALVVLSHALFSHLRAQEKLTQGKNLASIGLLKASQIRGYLDERLCNSGRAVHKLKSVARSLDALALGDLWAEIELAGRNEHKGVVSCLMQGFAAERAAVDTTLAILTAQHHEKETNHGT